MCDGFPCEDYDDFDASYEYEEYPSVFVGECTCFHDQDDHDWGRCGARDSDGLFCACEAGWEE